MSGAWERINSEGGPIGIVIFYVLGLGGVGLFIWRLVTLRGIRAAVDSQLAASTLNADNPLGRVLKIAEDNPKADTETLELKMAEQILNERPPIEKNQLADKANFYRSSADGPFWNNSRNDRNFPNDNFIWNGRSQKPWQVVSQSL
ncbi:MAG: hypothetical protein Ct9H300mP20_00390 [Gammaproteobacteria bacterium]|nr:MAG: hypothetical protein Ct9H300mP20_00390 [Gammaproteobacteria bacterium]